ncbi:MAG: rhomboid family intramembrane serine protease, partial [Firmicutes bacterium]|nr:rhomboid family intramembrane serine protease [Candidatus Fermentithermobacillaceae bacterium]
GVLGAYFVMFPRARVLALIPIGFFLPMVEVPSIVFLFLWFITNLLSGVASLGVTAQGGVAWWAHIGGFIAGMLLAIVMRRGRITSR